MGFEPATLNTAITNTERQGDFVRGRLVDLFDSVRQLQQHTA